MSHKDVVQIVDGLLLLRFEVSGVLRASSLVRLDDGVSFSVEGDALRCVSHRHGGEGLVLEKFGSERTASVAFDRIQGVLQSSARRKRVAKALSGLMKWGIYPAAAVAFALGLNVVATRGLSAGVAMPDVAATPLHTTPPAASSPLGLGGPPDGAAVAPPGGMNAGQLRQMLASRIQPAVPPELAGAMAEGVRSGKYSVQLSSGPAGKLYVFSDPSCPYCQDLERELAKLSELEVHVFPVSVIGGDASMHKLVKVMCTAEESRAGMWRRVARGGDAPGEGCAEGEAAVKANDQVYRASRFLGTPAILNVKGEQFPLLLDKRSDEIRRWVTEGAAVASAK